MAITTTVQKWSVMEMDDDLSEGIPIGATAAFSAGEKQHFIFGYISVLWGELVIVVSAAKLLHRGLIKNVGRLMR